MRAWVFNAGILSGVLSVSIGIHLLYGLGASLVAFGSLVISLTITAAMLARAGS